MNCEDQDMAMIDAALRTLTEHFDSVQVFASRHDESGTVAICRGFGNGFIRYAQARLWVLQEEEAERIKARHEPE